jgi:hypothetical protein
MRKIVYISDIDSEHEPFDTYTEQKEYDRQLKKCIKGIKFYLKGKRLDVTTFDNYEDLYNTADRLVFSSMGSKKFCDRYFGFYALTKDERRYDDTTSDCLKFRANDKLMCWQCAD